MLRSELWNACALPWKLACDRRRQVQLLRGLLDRRHRRADRGVGGRLKLNVTDGNWPWWLTASGATVEVIVANSLSGTCPALAMSHRCG